MKELFKSFLLGFGIAVLTTDCSTCHRAVGLVYRDNDKYIDDVVWGSPAEMAGIKPGGTLLVNDGHGHIEILDATGKLVRYDLPQVCVGLADRIRM